MDGAQLDPSAYSDEVLETLAKRDPKLKLQEKYGFLWPRAMHSIHIDLILAKKHREPKYAGRVKEPWIHLLRACRACFTPQQFSISPWTEEHAYDWTMETFCITWGCGACSKAQPLGAIVYTPTGPRTMGELQVGDTVLTQEGPPAKITATHDVGEQEEYRVEFRDGTSCVCAGSHLWEVRAPNPQCRPRVVSTEWLAANAKPGQQSIPHCAPAEFEPRPVLMDPYVLGALLGDGCHGGKSGTGVIRFSSVDEDILAAFRARLVPGYALNKVPRTAAADHCLVRANSRGRNPNQYIAALKHYGLWGKLSYEKHVPEDYLYNTAEVRRDVLAGLLDTDGCAHKGGPVSFSTSSPQLAKDFMFLVRSLGGRASMSVRPTSYRKKDGSLKGCRPAHIVYLRLPGVAGLFRCRRKGERVDEHVSGASRRYIERVVKTGACSPMKCITIDSPRGLYLTDDLVVTHNSNDYGCFSLLDWMTDPTETFTIMASTTVVMLQLRSFESMQRYFRLLKANAKLAWPGKESRQRLAIINDKDTDEGSPEATAKASIKGVAVKAGSVEEAKANLAGVHLPYVRLILDEVATMPEAAMDARINLMLGSRDFRLFALCNPTSIYDLAGRYSVPLKGWGSVSVEERAWRTKWGKVRHHDGLKSPALKDPEKYPYLTNQSNINAILAQNDDNPDSRDVWTMLRGWPPPQGMDSTVLSEAFLIRYKLQEPADPWRQATTIIAGLDPAFSAGGDKCVLQPARVGLSTGGIFTIEFLEPRILRIEASNSMPVLQQIAEQVLAAKAELGFELRHLGVDETGTQSAGDAIEMEASRATGVFQTVHRVSFGSKPSEGPVSVVNPASAATYYSDVVTQLWYMMSEYGRRGQIRGLPLEASRQFCMRRVLPKRPRRLEPKADCKKRVRGSPDEADACAVVLSVVRNVLGVVPGGAGPGAEALLGGLPTPGFDPVQVRRFNNIESDYASAASYGGVP